MTEYLHFEDSPPQVLLIDGDDYFVLSVWWAKINGVARVVQVKLISIPVPGGTLAEISVTRYRKLLSMRNINATRKLL